MVISTQSICHHLHEPFLATLLLLLLPPSRLLFGVSDFRFDADEDDDDDEDDIVPLFSTVSKAVRYLFYSVLFCSLLYITLLIDVMQPNLKYCVVSVTPFRW